MQERKVISIETKKCCNCGKTLYTKSDQFAVSKKQVMCSACWNARKLVHLLKVAHSKHLVLGVSVQIVQKADEVET